MTISLFPAGKDFSSPSSVTNHNMLFPGIEKSGIGRMDYDCDGDVNELFFVLSRNYMCSRVSVGAYETHIIPKYVGTS